MALKLVLYPFTRIREISDPSEIYAKRFSIAGESDLNVVRIYASTSCWILMDLRDTYNLADILAAKYGPIIDTDPAAPPIGTLTLPSFEALATALFDAMIELSRIRSDTRHLDEPWHGDLIPSNILVKTKGEACSFTLIDFGINYLYTDALDGPTGPSSYSLPPKSSASMSN